MAEDMPVFDGNDAWILQAVAMSGDGADLRLIISTGDYINHAILTGSELWQGFAKLTAAGHIIDQSGRFSLAGVAKATWEKQKRSRINVGAQFDACEALLRVSKPVPDKAMQDTRAWDYPSITDEMVKAATDAYLRDFWATKPSHNR